MRRRWWGVGLILVLVLLVAWGGWRWWSSDDEVRGRFISSLRESPGVTATRDSGVYRDVDVVMRSDASAEQVIGVARRARETDCCRLVIRQGSAVLITSGAARADDRLATRAELLTRLGQVDFPGSIRIPSLDTRMVRLDPDALEGDTQPQIKAAADVLDALDGASREAQTTVDSILGELRDLQSVVLVNDVQNREARRTARQVLDIAAGLDSLAGVTITDDARDASVAATVTDVADLSGRWDQLASPLGRVPGVRLEIEVPSGGDDSLTISGQATTSPARALDLVRVIERSGAVPSYVRTDLGQITARADNPTAAGRLARAVAPLVPATTNLEVAWGPGTDQAAGNRIEAPVAVVADLAPRLATLAQQGYVVGWDGAARRLVSRPKQPYPGELRTDGQKLRRMVQQIRAVDWPGEARLDLSMGASTASTRCANEVRTISFRSAASGPGRDYTQLGCSEDDDLAALQRAWDAGS